MIPADWEVCHIRDLAQIVRGASPRPIADTRWFDTESEVGWLRISDVAREGKYIQKTQQSLSDLGVARSRLVQSGKLVMSMAATVGRPAITTKKVCIHDGFVLFDKPVLPIEYFYYLLSSIEGQWAERGQTGSQVNLNTHLIGSAPVPIPPRREEQRAIAAALSDADALIESLDRLIAKKRAIKQAAMQQLLTGEARLPGFEREWESRRLESLGTFYKGYGIKRDDVRDEGVACIRYGEIYTRYGDYTHELYSRIPRRVADSAFELRQGDLLFAGSGETAEEIGMCMAYLGQEEAYAGGDIVVLRPKHGNPEYLGHLLNHSSVVAQKMRLGQGDAVVHISARSLGQIEILLPPEAEQDAIARTLSDMDLEIGALMKRRDKARGIKQGMMQELLTGRTRLVEPQSQAAEEAQT